MFIIAALWHDVGHGPWSHFWDDKIVDDDEWTHEKGSAKLLEYTLQTEEKVRDIFKEYNLGESFG